MARPSPLRRLLGAVILPLLAATACGGAVGVGDRPPAPPAAATAGNDPYLAIIAHSQDLGPVAADLPLSTVLQLRDDSQGRLSHDVAAMYDPSSPNYAHFLTPAEYAARYGPQPGEINAVRGYLAAHGISVDWQQGNSWLVAAGPAAAMESTFGIDVRWYRALDGTRFFAAVRDLRVPAGLTGQVLGASRVTNYQPDKFAIPVGGLTPTDVLAAYDVSALRDAAGDGSGQTIVVWGLDGYLQSDLDQFTQKYALPPIAVTDAPQSAPHIQTKKGGPENEMDIEVVHLLAPGAKLVIWNSNQNIRTIADFVNDLSKAVDSYPGAIFSHSWGLCDKIIGQAGAQAVEQVAEKAASLGETHAAGTGDMGGYDCMRNAQVWGQPPDPKLISSVIPASAPGFLAVGGTRLSVRQDSTWLDEVAWEHPDAFLGGGGSISPFFPQPSWQTGPGTQNQFNKNHNRTIPDVAADADDVSGISVFSQGNWGMGNGTSQAAPIWAGIITLIDAYLVKNHLKPVAFVNPALYAIAAGKPAFPAFHDITVGGNFVYPCTPGYDIATGIGSPDAWNLARDLADYEKNGGKV
ncbi:MAG TPA: S53 family peptidase [Candidatus Dormibacteraeota bacterium]